jgi:hypothetical protein
MRFRAFAGVSLSCGFSLLGGADRSPQGLAGQWRVKQMDQRASGQQRVEEICGTLRGYEVRSQNKYTLVTIQSGVPPPRLILMFIVRGLFLSHVAPC